MCYAFGLFKVRMLPHFVVRCRLQIARKALAITDARLFRATLRDELKALIAIGILSPRTLTRWKDVNALAMMKRANHAKVWAHCQSRISSDRPESSASFLARSHRGSHFALFRGRRSTSRTGHVA
jgi:hypothetical protein